MTLTAPQAANFATTNANFALAQSRLAKANAAVNGDATAKGLLADLVNAQIAAARFAYDEEDAQSETDYQALLDDVKAAQDAINDPANAAAKALIDEFQAAFDDVATQSVVFANARGHITTIDELNTFVETLANIQIATSIEKAFEIFADENQVLLNSINAQNTAANGDVSPFDINVPDTLEEFINMYFAALE